MKPIRNIFLLFFIILGISPNVNATHIAGSNINYECIGNDSFLITLYVYRDCQAEAVLDNIIPIYINNTCGSNFTENLFKQSTTEISQLCPKMLNSSTCKGGNWPGIEQHIYSGIVKIPSSSCSTWTIQYIDDFRNSQISNLIDPEHTDMNVYSTMYLKVDPCNTSITSSVSPPIPYVCKDQVMNYNFGITEPDGDSIVYIMERAHSSKNNATYLGTFTHLQPLPGANASLNSFNGQLTFTPTEIGVYVVAIRIEEYNRSTGVIKGASIRDIEIVVQSCTNEMPVVNSPGIQNLSGIASQLNSNTISTCIDNPFSFDISISDPDVLQNVTLYHNIYEALDKSATITQTNGNPATLHVSWTPPLGSPPFTSFSITGIDDSCPISGFGTGVFNIHIKPRTSAGPDTSICKGSQWKQLNATGGTQFIWYIINGDPIDTLATSPNFNMTCWNCDNPSVSPKVTTTYVVTSNISSCYNSDTITIEVNPNFNLKMNDTIICPHDSIITKAITDQPFSYTYKWSGSSYISDKSIPNPTISSNTPTSFVAQVEASSGCIKKATVFVDISQFPITPNIIGDTVICSGDSVQLNLSLGKVANSTLCTGNFLTGNIGSEKSTSTDIITSPYAGTQPSVVHQYLFKASELHAMGMTSGKIKSLSFENTLIGFVTSFNQFEIQMGSTNLPDLSSTWATGLTTVLPAYTHTVKTGWNKHSFISEYTWDGLSNLVIQICFLNGGQNTILNGTTSTKYSNTNFVSTRYSESNSTSACADLSTAITQTTPSRPNIQFDFCTNSNANEFKYSWHPNTNINNTLIHSPLVYPSTTTSYTVTIEDLKGLCTDTLTHKIKVVNQFDASFTPPSDSVCINGGLNFITPNEVGRFGIFSGKGIINGLNGVFDPQVVGVGTWPIQYDVSSTNNRCKSSFTKNITVIPPPDASFISREFCVNSLPDTLTPNILGGTWDGELISDKVTGIFTPDHYSPGLYPVSYTLDKPCHSSDTQNIRIIEPHVFALKNLIVTVCQGDSVNLDNNILLYSSKDQGSGAIKKTWVNSNNAVGVNGVFHAGTLPAGEHTVSLTIEGVDVSCATTQSMTIRVLPTKRPTIIEGLTFCTDNKAAKLLSSPSLYDPRVSFTQKPISPLNNTNTLNIHSHGTNGEFDASIHQEGLWQFEVTYTNPNGCIGVNIDTIHVLKTPQEPIITPSKYCEGDHIYLSATSNSPDSIYWYNDSLLKNTFAIGQSTYWGIAPNPTVNTPSIWVTQNNEICTSPKKKYILSIHPSPIANYEMSYTDTFETKQVNISFTNGPVFGYAPFLVQFNALNTSSTDIINWYHHWEEFPNKNQYNTSSNKSTSFNYSTSNLNRNNQIIDGTSVYINQLIVSNEFGCSDTASNEIYSIASEKLYNIFTPNGDGINDVFYIPIFGLTNYKAQIFNRWGKLIFEWEDPTIGWPGTDSPNGVYFYVITGIKSDINNTSIRKQGTVTLSGNQGW